MRRAIFVLLILLPLATVAQQNSWEDGMLDNASLCWGVCDPTGTSVPNPMLDLASGRADVYDDATFDAYMDLYVYPIAPGIGAAGNGIMYNYYWLYKVNDPAGQVPNYPYPPDGVFGHSFVSAHWWAEDGPGDDPAWTFYYGYTWYEAAPGVGITHFVDLGTVSGDIDPLTATLHWTVGRGLTQTLVPVGCASKDWRLTEMHGMALWFGSAGGAGIAPDPAPMTDRGPDIGYGWEYEFDPQGCEEEYCEEACSKLTEQLEYDLGSTNKAADVVEFKDPFNGVLIYYWDTDRTNATFSWASTAEEGELRFLLTDGADNELVYATVDEDTDGRYDLRGAEPGRWQLRIDVDYYSRDFAFEVQMHPDGTAPEDYDPELPESEDPGEEAPEEGNSAGADPENLRGDSGLQEAANRDSPLGLPILIAAIALALLTRRR